MFTKKGATLPTRKTSEMSGAMNGAVMGRRGLVAGTRVATAMGWRCVETIEQGDLVLTFDNGVREVIEVRRGLMQASADRSDWPLSVPAGALGNTEHVMLAPRQEVVIESDLSEILHGDPFAVVPARVLDGVRGIAPVFPKDGIEIVTLHFENEEVIFGGMGALFHCRAGDDLFAPIAAVVSYPRLTDAQARGVVEAMPPYAAEAPMPLVA